MPSKRISAAFGAPGIQPRWTRGDKDAVGTAYSVASKVWFTMAGGCLTEVYYPTIDEPQIRDLQFLITDGANFFHEERRDLDCKLAYCEEGALGACVVMTSPDGRYRLVKEIITDPHQNSVLMNVSVEAYDELLDQLHVYALCAPHLKIGGWNNNAEVVKSNDRHVLLAWKEDRYCVMRATCRYKNTSVGYVGASDGYQDVSRHLRMEWNFDHALDGNVAMIGEVDLEHVEKRKLPIEANAESAFTASKTFTLCLSFGDTEHNAISTLFQSLSIPFAQMKASFVGQWKRTNKRVPPPRPECGHSTEFLARSVNLLLAHEDKTYPGAMIASMSIPWGEMKGDEELGGYHLVWCRDLYQSATALLSVGDTATPLRTLIYLAISQRDNGGFSQNFWIDGRAYWQGVQLDEVAFPIMLAWRLREAGALENFHPMPMVRAAAGFLIREGPITAQERWEEASGYSPSTLAANITSLICAADFFRDADEEATARFIEEYADFLESHVEQWTVTNNGTLVPGMKRHYIRVNPVFDDDGYTNEDPDAGEIRLANQEFGSRYAYPANQIVDAGFLELVRYGVRAGGDPIMEESLKVIDAVLKVDTPKGPCWRRYNHDGYGQKADGHGYDGSGVGRAWPLLTGERGHYELAAGRAARPYIEAMERFAIGVGLIPEQVWDEPTGPTSYLTLGGPTGAATPLLWAHSEYIKLVQSAALGHAFDRFEPVHQRYVAKKKGKKLEVWSFRRRPRRIPAGVPLRILAGTPFRLVWSQDDWATVHEQYAGATALDVWYVDLTRLKGTVQFTFYWPEESRWEGRNFQVEIGAETATTAAAR
ncbi:MAG: glycoside hydrolase family 15 protein [Terriglobales bacterium]